MKNIQILIAIALAILAGFVCFQGCSKDDSVLTTSPTLPAADGLLTSETSMDGVDPPAGADPSRSQASSRRPKAMTQSLLVALATSLFVLPLAAQQEASSEVTRVRIPEPDVGVSSRRAAAAASAPPRSATHRARA